MVMTLIGELKKAGKGDATLLKKLFVLIGLLYQENRNKDNKSVTKNALDDLLSSTDDVIPTKSDKIMVEDPWKGLFVVCCKEFKPKFSPIVYPLVKELKHITFCCSHKGTCTKATLIWP